MIKLIAFDLDGTIGDTVPMCIRAFEKAVSPYAGHTLSEREITQTFGLNEVGMIKKVAGEKNSPATLSLMNKGNFLFNYSHYYLI